MQNKINRKSFFYNNSYLLVVAAWLITLSFIVDNYWSVNASVKSVQKNLHSSIHQVEKEFEVLVADTAAVGRLGRHDYSEKELKEFTEKKYGLFIYAGANAGPEQLQFWNTQAVQPDTLLLQKTADCGFVKMANGYYVWRQAICGSYRCVTMIPVKWDYYITNDYLQNTFSIEAAIDKNYQLSDTQGLAKVTSLNGTPLFYLDKGTVELRPSNAPVTIWMRLLATFCVLLFLHLLATHLSKLWNPAAGCIFLVMVVTLLRVVSYFVHIPLNFRQFELFDPTVYGSDMVLRSLGDLFINAGLFVWLVMFIRQQLVEKEEVPEPQQSRFIWLVLVGGALVYISVTLTVAHTLRTLVADSQIPFDVVNFAELNGYSIVGFIVISCITIAYFFLTQIIGVFIKPLYKDKPYLLYLIIAVCGLLWLWQRLGNGLVAFELGVLAWLLVYLYFFNSEGLSMLTKRLASSRLVFWLFFFSVSITAVIVIQNRKKEFDKRKYYAETLNSRDDETNQRLMNSATTDFRNDALAPRFSRFITDSVSSKIFRDSLIGNNLSVYKDKFLTEVYVFDGKGKPYFNPDATTLNTLNAITTEAKPTEIEGLYRYDISYDLLRYLFRREVKDSAGAEPKGYVFLLLTPKKYRTDALYPELFSKGYSTDIENSPVYAFAVYRNKKLVKRHNDYNFPTSIRAEDIPADEFKNKFTGGYDELWYKVSPSEVVVMARQANLLIESITLFSYLFCSFLLLAAILWLLNISIRSRFNWKRWKQFWELSIRNQVHATIIFISVLSFVVIGVATVLFFVSRHEDNNREKLSKALQLIEGEIRKSLDNVVSSDDVIKVYDLQNLPRLRETIQSVSDIHLADINVYDLEGNLQVASYNVPYENGIVSKKMNPTAFFHLSQLRSAQYFKKESIGSLTYLSNYIPLLDNGGHVYAYLNTPYFMSQQSLRKEISNFFVAIINLNAFIFLLAGIVALFIANRITRSFSFISNKMRDVNLGQQNEAITWNRNDEIGGLVKEYNKMVGQLNDSAAALAKSEREGAWREMARQVAHEIKNPLTPMKLSLQYLQKAIRENAPNVQELSISVAQTLVEQMDLLSQIAGEFSQFANIGNPKKEVFNLNEVLRVVTQLHVDGRIHLQWEFWPHPVMVQADRTQMNRLFTNLLQNAIQSVPAEQQQPVIRIASSVHNGMVLIQVQDNGSGIPEQMRSKIFTPNFTTKTSGTGLGLAMCKGIVEQTLGRIWFETKLGEGTTFYVELPLVEA